MEARTSARASWWWVAAVVAVACAAERGVPVATGFESGRGVTLVNLHPDNERSRLYAANFQQAGLIPVCSEVEYLGLRGDSFRFRVVATQREYEYNDHKAAFEPFVDHLRRFFGESCPAREIEALSELDRRGIREGKPIVGMTRRGIVLAMGPPPRHVNPDANAPSWMYWKSRFNRVEISFGPDDRVVGIRN